MAQHEEEGLTSAQRTTLCRSFLLAAACHAMAAAMDAEPSAPIDIEARAPSPHARARALVLVCSAVLAVCVCRLTKRLLGSVRVAWQAYAALYSGRTRAVRLLFAAERGGAGVELDALRLAAQHAKKGDDTQLYTQARAAAAAAARAAALARQRAAARSRRARARYRALPCFCVWRQNPTLEDGPWR